MGCCAASNWISVCFLELFNFKVLQSDFVVVLVCEIYNKLFCMQIMHPQDFKINPRLKELLYKQ